MKKYVFVVKILGGEYVVIERRVLLSATETEVTVTCHLRPAGEKFSRDRVFPDFPAALACYWAEQEGIVIKKRAELRRLERKLCERKEPRFIKGGY